jgi:ketosteroid isomerase-like protein
LGLIRDVVLRYVAALNAHDTDAVLACVTEDFVNEHTSVGGVTVVGRPEYRTRLGGFLDEFADLHYEVEDLLVDGDRAALAYTMTFGLGGVAQRVRGVFRFRVGADGLIAHRVDYWDSGAVKRATTP